MFIIEDPGRLGSKEHRLRQRNLAKSYASAKVRGKKRQQRSEAYHRSHRLVPKPELLNPTELGDTPTCISKGCQSLSQMESDPEEVADPIPRQHEDAPVVLGTDAFYHISALTGYVPMSTTPLESRSLSFFRQKAIPKWAGWSDAMFWNKLVLQIADAEPSARYALVSLSIFHEASELAESHPMKEERLKFAFDQNSKALAHLTRNYNDISMTAMISIYFVLAAVNTFVQDTSFLEIVRILSGVADHLRSATCRVSEGAKDYFYEYLEPAISRQRSTLGSHMDILWCMLNRPKSDFFVSKPQILDRFASIHEARETLSTLLNWTIYQTKDLKLPVNEVPCGAEAMLHQYLTVLDKFQIGSVVTERASCFIDILRVMAKIGFMLIKCIHADETDEMVFDQFTPVYAEFAKIFRRLINSGVGTSDGEYSILGSVDASLVSIVGQAATRWCREPSIRRDLIALLIQSKLREGILSAKVFAIVAEITMNLEEKGIEPPPTSCHQIPALNRVRMESSGISFSTHGQNILYRHFPFGPDDTTNVWIHHGGCGRYFDNDLELAKTRDKPHLILGRGYTSWLAPGRLDTYHSIRNPKFHFPIPVF